MMLMNTRDFCHYQGIFKFFVEFSNSSNGKQENRFLKLRNGLETRKQMFQVHSHFNFKGEWYDLSC